MDHQPHSERKLLYTVPEAAAALGVGRTMLYKLMATGELKPVHVGRLTRFTRIELERFVDELAVSGRHPQPARRTA